MPSTTKKLAAGDLYADLAAIQFRQDRREVERFGVELETLPMHFRPGSEIPSPVPLRAADGGISSLSVVEALARRQGIALALPGKDPSVPVASGASQKQEGGLFSFEPGGQVEYSSAPFATPTEAYIASSGVLDALAADLRQVGVELLTIGANPWHTEEHVGLQAQAPRYECMQELFDTVGPYGRRMMRLTAAIHVNVNLGPPVRAHLRWQVAHLLAPLALATFASSPFAVGMSSGYRSTRGLIWTRTEPSRCGFPSRLLRQPGSTPLEQYFEFAQQALVLAVRDPQGWYVPHPLIRFSDWMEHGFRGLFPTLEDWRYHLTTLFPEVRPKGFLELRAADAQPRAFWSVPLSWWTALLCSDQSLERLHSRLAPTFPDLPDRYAAACRDGLANPELAADSKFAYGLAADALLRFPSGFVSLEMQRAFVAFGELFTFRDRCPADALFELFLSHGFDREAWSAVETAWLEKTGTQIAR